MLILLLLVVVAAVAVVAAAGGAAALRGDGERSLLGGAGPPLLLLAGLAAVLVLGAAVMLLVGFRGGSAPDEDATAAPPTASVSAPTSAPAAPERAPVDRPARPAGTGPEVRIKGGGSPTTVDRLPETAVLVISAEGFKPGTGEVAQCGLDAKGDARDCRNGFPVEFGADGTARFQYLVSDAVHDGERCGVGQQPCLLVVFGASGEAEGRAVTVFHDPAPPPAPVTIDSPAGPNGDAVDAGPTARYHGGRLAGGLVLAALLLALAWRLFRSTDWREPAAAATPEMDRAVFDA